MGAIIRLTLGFFLSTLLHLFLIGGLLWIGRDLAEASARIEPEAMVLDLTMFSEPSKPTPTAMAEQIPDPESPQEKSIPQTKPLAANKPDSPQPDLQSTQEEAPQNPSQKQPPKISPENLSTKEQPIFHTPPPTKENRTKSQEEALVAIPHETPTAHTKPLVKQKTEAKQRKKVKKRQKNKKSNAKKPRRHHSGSMHRKKHKSSRGFNFNRLMSITKSTQRRLGFPKIRPQKRAFRVTVAFTLHANGRISGLRIIRRSGSRAIDRRALNVIRKASRRYPHPASNKKINITLRYGAILQ